MYLIHHTHLNIFHKGREALDIGQIWCLVIFISDLVQIHFGILSNHQIGPVVFKDRPCDTHDTIICWKPLRSKSIWYNLFLKYCHNCYLWFLTRDIYIYSLIVIKNNFPQMLLFILSAKYNPMTIALSLALTSNKMPCRLVFFILVNPTP